MCGSFGRVMLCSALGIQKPLVCKRFICPISLVEIVGIKQKSHPDIFRIPLRKWVESLMHSAGPQTIPVAFVEFVSDRRIETPPCAGPEGHASVREMQCQSLAHSRKGRF